jgi:hypothetical protein
LSTAGPSSGGGPAGFMAAIQAARAAPSTAQKKPTAVPSSGGGSAQKKPTAVPSSAGGSAVPSSGSGSAQKKPMAAGGYTRLMQKPPTQSSSYGDPGKAPAIGYSPPQTPPLSPGGNVLCHCCPRVTHAGLYGFCCDPCKKSTKEGTKEEHDEHCDNRNTNSSSIEPNFSALRGRYVGHFPKPMPILDGSETVEELTKMGFTVLPERFHGTNFPAAAAISAKGVLRVKSGFMIGDCRHGALAGKGVYVTPDKMKARMYAEANGIYAVVMTWDPPGRQLMWDDVKHKKHDSFRITDWTIGSRYDSCVCPQGAIGPNLWNRNSPCYEIIYKKAEHVIVRSWEEVTNSMFMGNGYQKTPDGNIVKI